MNMEDYYSDSEDEVDLYPTKISKELNNSLKHSGNSTYLNQEFLYSPGPAGDLFDNFIVTNDNNNSATLNNNVYKSTATGTCDTLSNESDTEYDSVIDENPPWICPLPERTQSNGELRRNCKVHTSILSEPLTSEIYNDNNKLKTKYIETQMIWTVEEANQKQVTQIGPSSCGATAVINTLKALKLPIPPQESIQKSVNTRLRANSAPLVEYLLSRSDAGCTHLDIIKGLFKASNGMVFSRFFHMFPERAFDLDKWLSYWIKKGAVPIATLNLQVCKGTIPDAWHHQMIHGVGSEGVYLTNPLECVPASFLWSQLCSKSELLVKKDDVVSRFNGEKDLQDFDAISDVIWAKMNVKEQVTELIKELNGELKPDVPKTHVRIPAEYKSGITLAVRRNTAAFNLLQQCPELPWLPTYIKVSLGE